MTEQTDFVTADIAPAPAPSAMTVRGLNAVGLRALCTQLETRARAFERLAYDGRLAENDRFMADFVVRIEAELIRDSFERLGAMLIELGQAPDGASDGDGDAS